MKRSNTMNFRKKVISSLLVTCLLSLSVLPAFAYSKGTPIPWKYANFYKSSSLPVASKLPLTGAMSTWNNAGSKFRFYDGGMMQAGTAMTTYNYKCEIGCVSFKTDPRVPFDLYSKIIAITTYQPDYANYPDIYLNKDVSFSTNTTWGSHDYQGVITHELGHALKLKDMYGYNGVFMPTMYAYIKSWPWDESAYYFRTLEVDDLNGVRALYPNT